MGKSSIFEKKIVKSVIHINFYGHLQVFRYVSNTHMLKKFDQDIFWNKRVISIYIVVYLEVSTSIHSRTWYWSQGNWRYIPIKTSCYQNNGTSLNITLSVIKECVRYFGNSCRYEENFTLSSRSSVKTENTACQSKKNVHVLIL